MAEPATNAPLPPADRSEDPSAAPATSESSLDLEFTFLQSHAQEALRQANAACEATQGDSEAHQQAELARNAALASLCLVQQAQQNVIPSPDGKKKKCPSGLKEYVVRTASVVDAQCDMAIAHAHSEEKEKRSLAASVTAPKKSGIMDRLCAPFSAEREAEKAEAEVQAAVDRLRAREKKREAERQENEREKHQLEKRAREAAAAAAAAAASSNPIARVAKAVNSITTEGSLRRANTATHAMHATAQSIIAHDHEAIQTHARTLGRGVRRSLIRLGFSEEAAQAIGHSVTVGSTGAAEAIVAVPGADLPLIAAQKGGTLTGILTGIATGNAAESAYHKDQLAKALDRNFNLNDLLKDRTAALDTLGKQLEKALETFKKDKSYQQDVTLQTVLRTADTDRDNQLELHELRALYERSGGGKATHIRGQVQPPPPSIEAIANVLRRQTAVAP